MIRKTTNEELNRPDISAFKAVPKRPVVIVLDNIRSFHNVGSAFRTADAFAIEAIYLCGFTPQPPHRDIHKVALGATETVAWKHFADTTNAIQVLKASNYIVAAVEQAEPKLYLQEFTQNHKPLALVFGSEVGGVSDEVLALCDLCVEIPQFGTKHSINVSVAIGVVLWQLLGSNANGLTGA